MGSKLGMGTMHFKISSGKHKMKSNIKKFSNKDMVFCIDLKEYGGSIESALDKIRSPFAEQEIGKCKIKRLNITPIDGTNLHKVELRFKVSL